MNFMFDRLRSPLILSAGRSGSMLLAHDIGQFTKCDLVTVSADHRGFLKSHCSMTPVHSHWLHSADDLARYTCFFSLRKNPVDTIMSWVCADHYNIHHLWSNEQNKLFESFTVTDWRRIDWFIQQHVAWCNHYTPMLLPEHQIVFYEDYVLGLPLDVAYRPTFPNKERLLTNYQQVADYISRSKEIMLTAQSPFQK